VIGRAAASRLTLSYQVPTSAHVDLASVAIDPGQWASTRNGGIDRGVGDALAELCGDVRHHRARRDSAVETEAPAAGRAATEAVATALGCRVLGTATWARDGARI
jgi:hypothetical protein